MKFQRILHIYVKHDKSRCPLDHVRAVLQWTLQLRHEAHNLPAIQLAAWFHDSIYDPRASDNEEQSALYATSVLSSLGMAHTTVHVVAHMIVCTKTHMADESEKDCLILLDADLAILGTNASDYDAYARAIRQEYHWVCEASYRLARARILQTLLERPRIYRTETLHVAQEKQARENLIREIGLLTRNP